MAAADYSFTLPGRYEIVRELGRGGMGRVLQAHDSVLARPVAIKVLSGPCSLDECYSQRFLTEARAAARLNHPNIVQVYEFGETEAGYYLVMEFVDGPSLGNELKRDGRFPPTG